MESAEKPLSLEFVAGVTFCLDTIDAVAQNLRYNPEITYPERIAIDKTLTIISERFRAVMKERTHAKPR